LVKKWELVEAIIGAMLKLFYGQLYSYAVLNTDPIVWLGS
jgi:hypothetical protein